MNEIQLSRTLLGKMATYWARKFSKASNASQANDSWLLEGVVWQCCEQCDTVVYPTGALCPNCLSEDISWQRDSSRGEVLGSCALHVSANETYHSQGPWAVGLIAHEKGPNLYTFMGDNTVKNGAEVVLFLAPDIIGQAVFIAVKSGPGKRKRAEHIAQKMAAASERFGSR